MTIVRVSSQCPYDVIPVPRHWDPENLIASNALGLVSMGFAL
ncbi:MULTISPECIES: WPE palindromic element domain-containing protein [unclassified Wolbachia]|nr:MULTISPECIES: WPE palindromic element domain-containing protein [unclassified Wolbachia]MDX5562362.1 WPE palindromic element domain-containing protein [Wolbachia endosymbiont of Andrena bicolor]MDX5596499.1 WPE palindromic element domain-containing protein [Wolbachia endosymbiont of Andrena labialis]RLT59774.1 wolbachia palindromic element domain protein [Wolbachia endosymbiont of Drosophila ananassae]RLT62058.1 wolbachia palindromic element domain protein [Wolbachia endosymbiont of Drosophi